MKPWTILDKLLWKIMVPLANLAVRPLSYLGITPNQLTLLNFLILIPLSAWAFTRGNYLWNLLGLFFALVYSYFDHVDGLLARATGKTSKFGAWLDQRLDIISSGIILAGITYGVLHQNMNDFWLGIGILAIFSQIGILAIVFEYENNLYHRPEVLSHLHLNKNFNLVDKIVIEFIFLRSFLFLFFGTLRYFLFLAVILNQMMLFLVLWAIFNNLRWMIMVWAYSLAICGQDSRWKAVKFLKKFLNEQ